MQTNTRLLAPPLPRPSQATRNLRTRNRRTRSARPRDPASVRAPTRDAGLSALPQWSPLVSAWMLPPVATSVARWAVRYQITTLVRALPLAQNPAQFATMVGKYGLLLFVEKCSHIDGPLMRIWQQDSLRRFRSDARGATLAPTAARDVAGATRWVYTAIDHGLGIGTTLWSLGMPCMGVATLSLAAPIVGALMLHVAHQYWQQRLATDADPASTTYLPAWLGSIACQAITDVFVMALNVGVMVGKHRYMNESLHGPGRFSGLVTDSVLANDVSHRAARFIRVAHGYAEHDARLKGLRPAG